MSENNNVVKSNTKNNFGYYISFVFLFVVISTTVGLHFYNKSLGEDIAKIKMDISSLDKKIQEEKNDNNLEIYSLVEKNKKVLDEYQKMNNISLFIDHMNSMLFKYRLEFSGFNVSNGEIKTSVKTNSDDKSIAYQKVKDFINQYRQDEKSLFELAFINSFEGMDEMKFDINFKIK